MLSFELFIWVNVVHCDVSRWSITTINFFSYSSCGETKIEDSVSAFWR